MIPESNNQADAVIPPEIFCSHTSRIAPSGNLVTGVTWSWEIPQSNCLVICSPHC